MTMRWWMIVASAAGIAMAGATLAANVALPGVWLVADGRVAPWADHVVKPDPAWPGREVRFEADRVVAPHPLTCDAPRYSWWFVAAEGLFEGNLPVPVAGAARELGMSGGPVPTLRVTCLDASFDFHRTPGGDLLLGLDNIVWRLQPIEPAAAPAAIVQNLLLDHFTNDMAFTLDSVSLKRPFLSRAFARAMSDWFAIPGSPEEAPAINGDPFTDTQEYPDHFTIGATLETPAGSIVPVRFGDDIGRRVDYVMLHEEGRWVVDDLVDGRGQSLRKLLAVGAEGALTGTARK
jgi:hypothetical protein